MGKDTIKGSFKKAGLTFKVWILSHICRGSCHSTYTSM